MLYKEFLDKLTPHEFIEEKRKIKADKRKARVKEVLDFIYF